MKIKKFFSLSALAAFLVLGSCSDDDYGDRFDKLEQQLQDVISQVEGAAALSGALDALQAQITTLQNAVTELPDGTALGSGLSELEGQLSALETQLAGLSESQATSEELVDAVAGLTSDLDLLKSDLEELLQSSNVLTGDLVIFDANSLAAAKALGDRVAIVNGGVKILADDLAAADLNEVTSKIVAVTSDMDVKTNKSLDFSKLESVGDDLSVFGNSVDLSGLRSVGDDLELAWEGDYDFPELTLVGNTIRLGVEESNMVSKSAGTGKAVSRIINFRNVTAAEVRVLFDAYMELDSGVYDMYFDWNNSSSQLFFPNATSIIFGNVPVNYLAAPIAETIELHYEGVLEGEGGVLVVVSSASNITAKAAEVEGEVFIVSYPFSEEEPIESFLSSLFYGFNPESFEDFEAPADWNAQINLPNLEAVGSDVVLVSNALTMPALEEFADNETYLLLTQENIQLPNLTVEGYLYISETARTLEFASISNTYIADATVITSLKANAQRNDITEASIGIYEWDALTTVSIFGATDLEEGITIDFDSIDDEEFGYLPVLENLVLGGLINDASIEGFEALTTLTTSGNINDLYIYDNDELVTLSLGHEHIAGLDGAELIVDDNDALEGLVTGKLDYIAYASITDNSSLTSIDLSSWKTLLVDFDGSGNEDQVEIYIYGNDLSGERTRYVPGSGTTAEQPELVKSSDLYSLKNIIDALESYAIANEYDGIKDLEDEFYIEFTIDKVDITTTETVEDNSLSGSSDDSFDYTWTETQDIISIVPVMN